MNLIENAIGMIKKSATHLGEIDAVDYYILDGKIWCIANKSCFRFDEDPAPFLRFFRSNFQRFMETYRKHLEHTCRAGDCGWDMSELPQVFQRMRNAILRGSFNKDSQAFRKTCKELGISHTYKAINAFISK